MNLGGLRLLEGVGLQRHDERVYRCVLVMDGCTADQVAASVDEPRGEVEATLARLVRLGLVTRADIGVPRYAALPPEATVLPLLLHRQEELAEAMLTMRELIESYGGGRHGRQLVTEVSGPGAVAKLSDVLMKQATREVFGCDRPPYSTQPVVDPEELAMLARGIRFRVIYDRRAVELQLDNLRQLAAAGEQARVLPIVPVKFMAVDGQVALVLLAAPSAGNGDAGPRDPVGLLIRRSDLLDALLATFEQQWANAVPLRLAAEPSDPEVPDREILALLLAGLTDTAIATRLGLSRRTVVRRVRELMDRAGATSRIQLGWHVARAGWLDGTPAENGQLVD